MNDLERLSQIAHPQPRKKHELTPQFDEAGYPMFHRTQQMVAEKMGFSGARVRKLEKNAIRKLRAAIEEDAALMGITVEQWFKGE